MRRAATTQSTTAPRGPTPGGPDPAGSLVSAARAAASAALEPRPGRRRTRSPCRNHDDDPGPADEAESEDKLVDVGLEGWVTRRSPRARRHSSATSRAGRCRVARPPTTHPLIRTPVRILSLLRPPSLAGKATRVGTEGERRLTRLGPQVAALRKTTSSSSAWASKLQARGGAHTR